MGKQVKVYTTASNPETGASITLAPGDEVPSGFNVGDHVYADPDESATPTEPVAGPGQTALTKAQAKQLEAELKAAKGDNGETGNEQIRTSAKSSADQGSKGGKG